MDSLSHPRRFARRPRRHPGARDRPARGLPAAPRAAAPRRRPRPVEWPARPRARVVPARPRRRLRGAGSSGMLAALLERGYRLRVRLQRRQPRRGAPTRASPAWCAAEGVPFVMEVVARTAADRKGGHIARRRATAGSCCARPPSAARRRRLVPRRRRWRFYNTNNLWVDLRALGCSRRRRLELPLIVNRKPSTRAPPTSRGRAARDRHGRSDRRVRRRPRDRGPADPLRAGQDDRRPARLRSDVYRLGDDARVERRPATTRRSSTSTASTSAARGLRGALPGRAAVARRAATGSSSAAT